MITAFEVGSIFKIVDQASPQLRTILKSAVALDKATSSIAKNLTAIGSIKLAGVASEIKAITSESAAMSKELGSSARAMARLSSASGGLSAASSAIANVSAATGVLAAEWRNVAAQAATALTAMRAAGRLSLPPPGGVPPPLPGGRGGRGGGGGGRHGPQQGFHFGRFGASVPVLGGHVHASAPSSGTGVGVGAGLFGLYELAKAGVDPLHEETKLRLLGIPDATMGRMRAEARDIASSVPGSGYTHNLQTMGELYSIVGAEGAMAIAPRLAEIDRVQGLVGGKGKEQGSAYVLTRATELMGKLTGPDHQPDLQAFGNILDTMSRVSIATHGKVTPEEWLNYAKQAGPASGSLTDEGLYTTAAIIQAMGGNRAGTAAAAIARQFAGGVMTKSKADELTKIGIFKQGDYSEEKGGHIQFHTDAASGFVGRLQHDPLTAIVTDLIPALESHGFSTNEQISKEIYKIIGTGPAQREIYELIRGREQIRQERERAQGAMAPGASLKTLNADDPLQAAESFSKAFKDLLGALGGPLMQAALPAMNTMTALFNNLASIASNHSQATGVLTTIGAGAGVGAAAGFGIGWLGGPGGAGTGALVGGALGAGYGVYNTLPDWAKSAYGTGARMLPGVGLGLDIWSGLGGLLSPAKAGGMSVMPPPQDVKIEPAPVSIYLGVEKIGEAVIKYIARQGGGAVEGAPYHDSTHSFSPLDFALPG